MCDGGLAVFTQAKDIPDVVIGNFPQLEDNINELVWVSNHQAAVATRDGFLYAVELRADGQWRLKKCMSKPTGWLVGALVPEAPGELVLGLATVSLSDQLEKLLSVDTAGVVKMWDFPSR